MIEKLHLEEFELYNTDQKTRNLSLKINEIIDAVNELQKQIDKVSCAILDLATPDGENKALKIIQDHRPNMVMDDPFGPHPNIYEQGRPADPYAEQRKWIGCVCRFWYDNPEDTVLDYLGKIRKGENGIEYYGKETYNWFPHCEPILPTDNAIYKGGENE